MQQLTREREQEHYGLDFARTRDEWADDPSWVRALRQQAFARFLETPFPTLKDEDWKYTNVAPIVREGFRLSTGDTNRRLAGAALEHACLGGDVWARLVFLDGVFLADQSTLHDPDRGIAVLDLAEAVLRYPEVVERHLGAYAPPDVNAFTALNTAYLRHGAFVHVCQGVPADMPIHLVFVSSGTGTGNGIPTSHPRTLVVADPGTRVSIVESYVSLAEQRSLSNAVTEIALAEDAVVEHTKMLLENEVAYHIGTTRVHQERGSTYTSFSLAVGALLARNQLDIMLDGEGASCVLDGLYAPTGSQHIDNHTMIDHRTPHGTSRQLYKGVLADHSRAVFNGKVIVRPGAQRTDAQQTNRNLLISDDAVINTKPQLEIFADDVKCTHGATVGQLDEDAFFYLLSRGIGAQRARALLTYAFASDVVDRVQIEPLRACMTHLLLERLEPEASIELAAGELAAGDRVATRPTGEGES